jgi:hypothetical protein
VDRAGQRDDCAKEWVSSAGARSRKKKGNGVRWGPVSLDSDREWERGEGGAAISPAREMGKRNKKRRRKIERGEEVKGRINARGQAAQRKGRERVRGRGEREWRVRGREREWVRFKWQREFFFDSTGFSVADVLWSLVWQIGFLLISDY